METLKQKQNMLELAEVYTLERGQLKFRAFPSNSLQQIDNSVYPLDIESPEYSLYTTKEELSKYYIDKGDKFINSFGIQYEVLNLIPDDLGWFIIRIKRITQTNSKIPAII